MRKTLLTLIIGAILVGVSCAHANSYLIRDSYQPSYHDAVMSRSYHYKAIVYGGSGEMIFYFKNFKDRDGDLELYNGVTSIGGKPFIFRSFSYRSYKDHWSIAIVNLRKNEMYILSPF